MRIGLELKDHYLGISVVLAQIGFGDFPVGAVLPKRRDLEKMFHCHDKDANHVAYVRDDGEIGHAVERTACHMRFLEDVRRQRDRFVGVPWIAGTGFDRDSHEFLRVGVSRDEVDTGVVDPRAFEAVLGQPVQHKGFGEVSRDL